MLTIAHRPGARRFAPAALLFLTLSCLAPAARADFSSHPISGDTTGGPTFNRPGLSNPQQEFGPYKPTTLSGSDVRYSLIPFNVSLDGEYRLFSLSQFDNYLLLYRESFDPSSPLNNVLLARDGFDDDKGSFTATLSAGVVYYAVVTGSRPGDFGRFTLDVSGYGDVNYGGPPAATPEPAALALLATGLSGAGAVLRRRRQKRDSFARPTPRPPRPAGAARRPPGPRAASAGDCPP